jgi:mannose-6-phosphate isomerase-like protein (cupin superfamily)
MELMKKLFGFAIIGLICFSCGGGEPAAEIAETEEPTIVEETTEPEYLDPVIVASDNYTLLSDTLGVRIIEMILEPGQTDNMHSHMNESVYFITGGMASIKIGDEVMEAEVPDGHVMHSEPWTHQVTNTGTTTIHALIFERTEIKEIAVNEEYIDVTEVSPDIYKVISEEGNVRIIEMTMEPGQQDEMHSHYPTSFYSFDAASVEVHMGDKTMEMEAPAGFTHSQEAVDHWVKNVGATSIRGIIFEQMPTPITEEESADATETTTDETEEM